MSAPGDVIERFYGAFARGDGAAMAACYAPDVLFSDPVFPELRGERAGAMWRMLTAQAQDFSLELVDHQLDAESGSAHWIARYTFSRTGNSVVNDVHATFKLAGGLITEHRDRFEFWRWSRQALGPVGLLLGWSPVLRAQVRGTAAASLDTFVNG